MRNSVLRLLHTARAGCTAPAQEVLRSSLSLTSSATNVSSSGAPATLRAAQAWSHSLHTSSSASHAAVAVEGNVDGVLKELDKIVSSEQVTAKELSSAAYALAYLNSKADRRLWGKLFEKAAALKASFDPASLSAFLWAASAAKVDHFRTVYELSAPAAAQLGAFSASQLSFVAEAFGRSKVDDVALWSAISDKVTAGIADYKPAELARVLWGFAAAGQRDEKLLAAAGKALATAGDVGAKELGQVVWALATLRAADKPLLDAAAKQLAAKAGSADSAADVAAALWGFASLGYAGDVKKAAAAVAAAAGSLSTSQAIHGGWALANLGDKEAAAALLGAAAAKVAAAPEAVEPADLAAFYEAATISGAAVPPQVLAYSRTIYGVVSEHSRLRQPAAVQSFKSAVKAAAAKALGARYKPTVAKTAAGFAQTTADGIAVELVIDLDKNTKIAVEAVPAGTAAGAAQSRAKLLQAAGLKVALLNQADFPGDEAGQVAAVLKALDGAVAGAGKKAAGLVKEQE